MYGMNVNMSEIVEASLKDDLPENMKKIMVSIFLT